jgi:hypothetical protein
MTRKDFNAIASIMRAAYVNDPTGAIWCLALSMADYFQAANPNFNRGKFYSEIMGNSDHFAARDAIPAFQAAKKNTAEIREARGDEAVRRMFQNETI